MGTIIVLAVVAGMAALAIRKIYMDKKSGKGCCSCGGSCSGCVSGTSCGCTADALDTDISLEKKNQ